MISTAGVSLNVKKQIQAFFVWSKAESVHQDKQLSSIVSLQMVGSVTSATVAGETGNHTLSNVLDDWGCCSCKKAMQQQICYHHVLALLASFPKIKTKDFSDALVRLAGRRFGADEHCHHGLGGMAAFTHRLKELQKAMTEVQGIPILQSRTLPVSHVPANLPVEKVRMAHGLLIQLYRQQSSFTKPNYVPADVHHINKSSAQQPAAVTSPEADGLQATDVSQ
jgi:hypothetical protein